MKMAKVQDAKKWQVSLAFTVGLVALVCLAGMALAQEPEDAALTSPEGGSPTETFAYQGYLEENGQPANGVYDFRFSVWDQQAAGSQLGNTMEFDSSIEVVDGVFTAYLYPAPANQVFTGGPRWLQIEVRAGNSVGPYTNLGRQPIVPAPYAWSLRPFGLISGDTGSAGGFGKAVLNVDNTRDYALGGSSSAIYARATTGSALHGESGGVGVYGYSTDTYGVAGFSSGGTAGHFSSSGGYGVYAETWGDRHWDHGGYFKANMGYGVYAYSAQNYGVRGEGYFGVGGDGQQTGVIGSSTSGTGRGVYGRNSSGVGVEGSSNTGIGVLGVRSGYSESDLTQYWKPGGLFAGNNGVIGLTKTNDGYGVVGWDKSAGGGWAGVFRSDHGSGVYITAAAGKTGLTVASGTKNAVVDAGDGSRLLYSEEATEVWFADYGFGRLEGELTVVSIDATYAQTVNLEEPYHVFVQVYGDADVYVTNRTASQFEVHLREGEPNVEFSYRIVAKRVGYEDDRLERAPWADNDPNLYPEKSQGMNVQQDTSPQPGGEP